MLDGAAVHAQGRLYHASFLPERLVTPSCLLTEPCPVLCFSCETFWNFHAKISVFFSTGGESITSQFVWGVWRLIILQTGLSEYFSLISLGGWSGSGHVLMGPSISWLTTEPGLWLRHSHTVAALASRLLHPPLNILCVLQSMCISDRELNKGRCSGFKFIPENLIEKYVLDL